MDIQTKRRELAFKQSRINKVFDEIGEGYDLLKSSELEGKLDERQSTLKSWVEDLEELKFSVTEAEATQKALRDAVEKLPDASPPDEVQKTMPPMTSASLGALAVKNMDAILGKRDQRFALTMKALFQSTATYDTLPQETGVIGEYGIHEPNLFDIIPQVPTSDAAVQFYRESVPVKAAAPTAEGATVPEATISFVPKTESTERVGVTIPITDQALSDTPRLQAEIDGRLTLYVRDALENQILNGNGTSPNLKGLLDFDRGGDDIAPDTIEKTGFLTQKSASIVDTIYKAITNCFVNSAVQPNYIVMNPMDWYRVRISSTSDGSYLFGPPSMIGANSIFGYPVLQNTQLAAKTVIVGAFSQCTLYDREDISVDTSNSHGDNFPKYIMTMRASVRAAFAVIRPNAFYEVILK